MGSQVNVGFLAFKSAAKNRYSDQQGQELIYKNDGHFDH